MRALNRFAGGQTGLCEIHLREIIRAHKFKDLIRGAAVEGEGVNFLRITAITVRRNQFLDIIAETNRQVCLKAERTGRIRRSLLDQGILFHDDPAVGNDVLRREQTEYRALQRCGRGAVPLINLYGGFLALILPVFGIGHDLRVRIAIGQVNHARLVIQHIAVLRRDFLHIVLSERKIADLSDAAAVRSDCGDELAGSVIIRGYAVRMPNGFIGVYAEGNVLQLARDVIKRIADLSGCGIERRHVAEKFAGLADDNRSGRNLVPHFHLLHFGGFAHGKLHGICNQIAIGRNFLAQCVGRADFKPLHNVGLVCHRRPAVDDAIFRIQQREGCAVQLNAGRCIHLTDGDARGIVLEHRFELKRGSILSLRRDLDRLHLI